MSFKETEPLISLDTGKDLSTASNPEIHYKKPVSGDTGEWTGTISGQKVEYQTTDGDLDEYGTWQFQAVVDFGSNTQKGDIYRALISEPIKTT